MRPVKAREAGVKRNTRSGGRSAKPQARGQAHRAAPHGEPPDAHSPEAVITRLQDTFAFRHPMLSLTLALMAFGLIAGLLAGGHMTKTEAAVQTSFERSLAGAGFAVRKIDFVGYERTPLQAAVTALGIEKGVSIFAVDPDAARKRLLKLPWVADAEVRRRFPDWIAVRLVERRPFAVWRRGETLVIIDRLGTVITELGKESLRLPVLIGAGAPEAAAPFIDALGGYKAIGSRLRQIERISQRRWDLLLAGGVTVRLPEEGWESELAELERLIAEKSVLDRNIEVIDLRYPDNYVFRLHNGDSRPVPREQRA